MAVTRLLSLPTDIVCGICGCLSIRDVTRLSCVCKYLRSLITHTNEHVNLPYYHLCHSSHKKNSLVIFNDLYCPSKTSWQDPEEVIQQFKNIKLTDPLYLGDFRFIGSCNGIICFGKWAVYGTNKMTIYLWNPSLHQIRPLPQCPIAPLIMYFEFLGFGYDVSSEDCKFVRIYYTDKVDIYSLKSNSWKRINYISTRTRFCYGGFTLNFNGCLYWILISDTHFGIYGNIKEGVECSILSFNIASEKLSDYLIPCSVTNNGLFCGLGVFKGCLSFLMYYQCDDKYEIWSNELKSDKSWTKTHGFNHNKLSYGDEYTDRLEHRPFYRFLFTPGGKIFVRRANQLMLLDLEADPMDIIEVERHSNSSRHFVANYVESLFSVMPTENVEQLANYERAEVSPISNGEKKKKKIRAKRWFRCFFGC